MIVLLGANTSKPFGVLTMQEMTECAPYQNLMTQNPESRMKQEGGLEADDQSR
jgi:hypothetical protein